MVRTGKVIYRIRKKCKRSLKMRRRKKEGNNIRVRKWKGRIKRRKWKSSRSRRKRRRCRMRRNDWPGGWVNRMGGRKRKRKRGRVGVGGRERGGVG